MNNSTESNITAPEHVDFLQEVRAKAIQLVRQEGVTIRELKIALDMEMRIQERLEAIHNPKPTEEKPEDTKKSPANPAPKPQTVSTQAAAPAASAHPPSSSIPENLIRRLPPEERPAIPSGYQAPAAQATQAA